MIEDIKNFIELTREKRALQAELRKTQAELDAFESVILDAMLQEGVGKMTVNDMTVFPRTDLYLEKKEGADPVGSLIEAEMVDCLMVSSQRIKALAREARDGEAALPPAIAACYTVVERARLSARKAEG